MARFELGPSPEVGRAEIVAFDNKIKSLATRPTVDPLNPDAENSLGSKYVKGVQTILVNFTELKNTHWSTARTLESVEAPYSDLPLVEQETLLAIVPNEGTGGHMVYDSELCIYDKSGKLIPHIPRGTADFNREAEVGLHTVTVAQYEEWKAKLDSLSPDDEVKM